MKLKETNYFYEYTQDEDDHIASLFFANPRSIEIFSTNHDILIIDATYKTN